jgi:hypothetical protein
LLDGGFEGSKKLSLSEISVTVGAPSATAGTASPPARAAIVKRRFISWHLDPKFDTL